MMRFCWALWPVVLFGCGANSGSAPNQVMDRERYAEEPMELEEAAMAEPSPAGRARPKPAKAKKADRLADDAPPPPPGAKDAEGEAPATRQWFPESFLWQPLVETSEDGVAVVDVRVPDQLTTWRVLALAHDRQGHQSGAVHTFDSTLPVYVDPVVPGWLYAGDRLALPVQVVNTTEAAVQGGLQLDLAGPLRGAGQASVTLAGGGSEVLELPVDVRGAGVATVKASLRLSGGGGDAAERRITVLPQGRPVERVRGGTLGKERSFSLIGPQGADSTTEELQVLVFPGPLAVLQSELERVGAGQSAGQGAYGFALAQHLQALSEAVGVEVNTAASRRLRILAWQRIAGVSRSPSAAQAADILLALPENTGHELADLLRPRLVRVVTSGQRADGTWSRDATSTAQRVLVETSLGAMALPQEEVGPRLRASGALERLAREAKDPYTAAVMLATGLTGGVRVQLMERLKEGLSTDDAGGVRVEVPDDVRNAWGLYPSRAEVLAFTALALGEEQAELRGDVVATLMQGWNARGGFGAGPADAVALRALVEALPATTQEVELTLEIDGHRVSSATLDPSQPLVPALLGGAPAGGAGEVRLVAEPAVPGLTFVATRRSWVPWTREDQLPGVDVEVDVGAPTLGQQSQVVVRLAAPAGTSVAFELPLPAGMSVEDRGFPSPSLTSWTVHADRVVFSTMPFEPGQIVEVPVLVSPAFRGQFGTAPLVVSAGGRERSLAPPRWVVR